MVQQPVVGTLLVVLCSLVGAGVATQLEERTRFLVVARAILSPDHPTVLRDCLNFLWVAGGAILGGYVAVALRQVTGLFHIVRSFAVSVATALAVTPYVLVTWFSSSLSAEACFILGFLFAVIAWLAWEVLGIVAIRIKRAARLHGWSGVKQELLGKPTHNSTEE